MGNFFQPGSGNSVMMKVHRKITPKEFKKAMPKEIQGDYIDRKVGEELGYGPVPVEQPPGIAPPEQIDEDAYRVRQRSRRRAQAGSTIRTSPAGAPYSPAPKSLLGG